jgi:O-antigen/teichoic acid export membrane protein
MLVATIVDQALWSLAGFAAGIVVGRALGAAALGAYAVGLAVMYGIGGFYQSLVLEPSAVLGVRRFGAEQRAYGGALIVGTFLGLAPLLLLGGLIAGSSSSPALTAAGAAVAATPALLTGWAARRLAYLDGSARLAAVGSMVYLLAMLGTLGVFHAVGALTVVTAFAGTAFAALLQTAFMVIGWRPSLAAVADLGLLRRICDHHWDYGRWLVAANAASWVVNYGYGLLAALLVGLAGAGGLRASQNLLNVVGLLFTALSYLYVPQLAALAARRGPEATIGLLRRIAAGMALVGLLLTVTALVAGDALLAGLYGAEFRGHGWILAAIAGTTIVQAVIAAASMGLQAAERPKEILVGQGAGALVALPVGLLAGALYGLEGLIVALWLATLVRAAVLVKRFGKVRAVAGPQQVSTE